MAIRFQCGACSQPIEIDDEWAQKTVACPYCRNTITAPASSTLSDLDAIPTASPVGDPQAPQLAHAAASWSAPSAHPNRIAIVAAVFATCIVVSMISLSLVLGANSEEVRQWTELVQEQQTFGGMMTALQGVIDENGGALPGWMVGMMILQIGIGLSWITALVCGIIAVRRPLRRAWAMGALAVCVFTPLLFCCGGLVAP